MAETRKFRNDLIFYQFGAIIPSINNFLNIFILKHFLPPEDFGFFSLRMGLSALISLAGIGWLSQSIVRLVAAEREHKTHFLKGALLTGGGILAVLAGGAATILTVFFDDAGIAPILMAIGCVSSGIQLLMVSYIQANFNSKSYLVGEALRTGLYLGLSFLAVTFFKGKAALPLLWAAFIVANLFGSLFLLKKCNVALSMLIRLPIRGYLLVHWKRVVQYGAPLALWFIIISCMNYVEKPLLLVFTLDYGKVGNYQAMYDILNKGATLILYPIGYALFPHLVQSFEQNDLRRTRGLLKKIIGLELLLLALAIAAYLIFGFNLLVQLFSLPDNNDFYTTGLIVLVSTFVWQLAIIMHKPLELKKRTLLMARWLFISFVVYVALLYGLTKAFPGNLNMFAIPALVSGLAYNLLTLYSSKKI